MEGCCGNVIQYPPVPSETLDTIASNIQQRQGLYDPEYTKVVRFMLITNVTNQIRILAPA